MTLLLAATLLLQTPDDPKVDYTSTGARLAVLIPELGKSVKQEFKVDPAIDNEVAIVRIHDVPLSQAIQRINQSLDLSFEKTKTGYFVRRTPELKKLRIQRDFDDRVAKVEIDRAAALKNLKLPEKPETDEYIRSTIAKFLKAMTTGKNDDEVDFEMPEPGYKTKSSAAVLRAIDSKTVASMYAGQRIVYSTLPTNMQRPIPSALRLELTQYLTDARRWHQIVTDTIRSTKATDEKTKDYLEYAMRQVSGTNQDVRKINIGLVVDTGRGLDVQIELISAANTIIDSWQAVGESDAKGSAKLHIGNYETNPDEPKIEPSDFAKSVSKRLQGTLRGTPPTDDEIKLLLHPELNDPLALSVGPWFIHYAEQANKNLIAVVSDSEVYGALRRPQSLTAAQFLNRWKTQGEYTVKDENGWATFLPPQRITVEERRSPRKQFAEYAQLLYSDRVSNLDEQVAYALDVLKIPTGDLVTPYCLLLLGSLPMVDRDLESGGHNDLSFYRSLTDFQRQSMQNGGVQYRSLGLDQQAMLRQLIFDEELSFARPPRRSDIEAGEFEHQQDITDLLPTGIPENAVVSMTDETVTSARTLRVIPPKNPKVRLGGWDAEAVASNLMANETANKTGKAPIIRTDRIVQFETRHVAFKLQIAPKMEATFELSYSDGRAGKEIDWKDLPAGYQSQISKALTEMRQSAEERQRQTVPPPAPSNVPKELLVPLK